MVGVQVGDHDRVHLGRGKMGLSLAHRVRMRDAHRPGRVILKHLQQQPGIGVAVFDQQQFQVLAYVVHALGSEIGSLALVSQKSLMLCTNASKSSKRSGLLR